MPVCASVSMSFCLSVCLYQSLSVCPCLPVYQSLSVSLSACISVLVCRSVCMYISLCLSVLACLYISPCLSVCLHVYQSLSVSLSACISVLVCQSVCMYISPCLSVCLHVYQSLSVSLSACISVLVCQSVCMYVVSSVRPSVRLESVHPESVSLSVSRISKKVMDRFQSKFVEILAVIWPPPFRATNANPPPPLPSPREAAQDEEEVKSHATYRSGQIVERKLSMQEVQGSMPGFPIIFFFNYGQPWLTTHTSRLTLLEK